MMQNGRLELKNDEVGCQDALQDRAMPTMYIYIIIHHDLRLELLMKLAAGNYIGTAGGGAIFTQQAGIIVRTENLSYNCQVSD